MTRGEAGFNNRVMGWSDEQSRSLQCGHLEFYCSENDIIGCPEGKYKYMWYRDYLKQFIHDYFTPNLQRPTPINYNTRYLYCTQVT